MINLFINRPDHGLKVGSGVSTLKFIFCLSGRKLMQDTLHHRKFI